MIDNNTPNGFYYSSGNNPTKALAELKKEKEEPKPAAPKVDKKELEHSIKSHEQAKSQNQTVKK